MQDRSASLGGTSGRPAAGPHTRPHQAGADELRQQPGHHSRRLLTDRINLERIRQDRILHEALISGADPLRLALVFGIDHSTAMTYADLARQILAGTEPTSN